MGEKAIFELPFVSKRVPMQNLSYENEFDLHKNEPVWFHTKTCFDTERTRKWPINIKCVQTWLCKLLSRRSFKDKWAAQRLYS